MSVSAAAAARHFDFFADYADFRCALNDAITRHCYDCLLLMPPGCDAGERRCFTPGDVTLLLRRIRLPPPLRHITIDAAAYALIFHLSFAYAH